MAGDGERNEDMSNVQQEIEAFEAARREYRRQRGLDRPQAPETADPMSKSIWATSETRKRPWCGFSSNA